MISIGDALLKLGVDDSGLKNSLKGIGGTIEGSLKSSIAGAGMAIAGFGVAAVGAGIAATEKFAETAHELELLSQKTGMGTTALQEYGYAAKLSGSDMSGFEGAVKRMQVNIEMGSKAVATLGIDLSALKGLKPEEQFSKIADMISAVADPADRAAMAVKIFGKAGTDMLPMILGGSKGLQDMAKEANSLGVIMDEGAVKSGASFQEGLEKMEAALGGVVNQIGAELIPVLQPVIPMLMDLIKTLPIKELGKLVADLLPPLVQIIEKIIKAIPMDVLIKLVEAVLVPVLDIITALLPALTPILNLVGIILGVLTPIVDVLGKIVGYIAQIIGSGLASEFSLLTGGSGAWNMPALPSFAGGGIVPGPAGAPVPILAHGGEVVGQGGLVINVAGSVISERNLADIVDRVLYGRLNASGLRSYT